MTVETDTLTVFDLNAHKPVRELDDFTAILECTNAWYIEIVSVYSSAEYLQSGDTLARKRADDLVAYFETRGMKREQFIIKIIPFKDRPMKSYDGKIMKECNAVYFRILSYR